MIKRIRCPGCREVLALADPHEAGDQVRCEHCGKLLRLPARKANVVATIPPKPTESPTVAPIPTEPATVGFEQVAAGPATLDFNPRTRTGDGTTSGGEPSSSDETRYRILRSHAKGGLGEVFRARDEELGREVALKQIQRRFADQPQLRARFVKEAEITGRLEHPGIVPIYGLARDEHGRPYYAMRFIEGESLKDAIERFHAPRDEASGPAGGTSACDMLEFRQLLGRFQSVCNTMAYAHSKGVLHRDLKPANIMLGPYGETLVVDWGLARALKPFSGKPGATHSPDDSLPDDAASDGPTGDSSLTQPGTIMGTPAYMSPEQAEGRLDDLGPASDIWSLGATLYCLLTGHAPFVGDSGPGLLLKVREGDFPAPRRDSPWVPAPLDAVCMKAMTLRPEDRYASATDLAQDIERWLADEPVSAYREPLTVRVGRWQRRHRTLVASLVILLFTTLFGAALGGWLLSLEQARTQREKDEKLQAERKLNEEQHKLTVEQAKTIQEQQGKLLAQNRAAKVSQYLFTVLRSPDPSAGDAHDIPIGKVLDAAVLKVDKDFQDDPLMRADILGQLARTYHGLGVPKVAVDLYRRAWELLRQERGERDADTVAMLNSLVVALIHVGRPGEGITLLTPHGQADAKDALTLTSMLNLGLAYQADGRTDKAVDLLTAAQQGRATVLGPDHADTLLALTCLASAHLDAGNTDLALQQGEQGLEKLTRLHGLHHADTLLAEFIVGNAWLAKGDHVKAAGILERNLQARQQHLGAAHRDTILSMGRLAEALLRGKRLDRAIPYLEREHAHWRKALGPEHETAVAALDRLTEGYILANDADRALSLMQFFFDGPGKGLPAEHPRVVAFQARLGFAHEQKARWRDAVPVLETAYVAMKKSPQAYQDKLARVRDSLLRGHENNRDNDKAEAILSDLLAEARRAEKVNEGDLAATLARIGSYRLQAGKFAEAEAPCRECLAIREKSMSGHWLTFNAQSMLGDSLLGQKKFTEAEPLLLAAHEGLKAQEGKIPVAARARVAEATQRLVSLYKALDQADKLRHWQAQLSGQLGSTARFISGELTKTDAVGYKKNRGAPYDVHELEFEKGRTYFVEIASAIDANLCIQDAGQVELFNDEFRSRNNSQAAAIFKPPATGKYRVIVSTREKREGPYFLRAQEMTYANKILQGDEKNGGEDVTFLGRAGKRFPVSLIADQVASFELTSVAWENELTLLDPSGTRPLITEHGTGQGPFVARVFITPPASGNYWLLVTNRSKQPPMPFKLIGRGYLQEGFDPDTMLRLARGYLHAGRYGEAIPWLEKCSAACKKLLGTDHPDTLRATTWLAHVYVADDRLRDALPLLREVEAATRSVKAAKDAQRFLALVNLAAANWAGGAYAEAIQHIEEAVKTMPEQLPADVPFLILGKDTDFPDPEKAILKRFSSLLENLKAQSTKKFGADHPVLLTVSSVWVVVGFEERVGTRHTSVNGMLRDRFGYHHPYQLNVLKTMALYYAHAKDPLRTGQTILHSLRLAGQMYGPIDLRALQPQTDLAWTYILEQRYADAEADSRYCESLYEKYHPEHWLRYWAMSVRGASLAGQKKFAEAEPLVLKANQELAARVKELPPSRRHLPEQALDNVISLYDAWGQADRAREWRKKRAPGSP